jgi:hypothetical protein
MRSSNKSAATDASWKRRQSPDNSYTPANRDARAGLIYVESGVSGRVHGLDQCIRNIPAKLFDYRALTLKVGFKQIWPVFKINAALRSRRKPLETWRRKRTRPWLDRPSLPPPGTRLRRGRRRRTAPFIHVQQVADFLEVGRSTLYRALNL